MTRESVWNELDAQTRFSHPPENIARGDTVDHSLRAVGVGVEVGRHPAWAAMCRDCRLAAGPDAVSPFPEIDPARMGTVHSLVSGTLVHRERRRRRA